MNLYKVLIYLTAVIALAGCNQNPSSNGSGVDSGGGNEELQVAPWKAAFVGQEGHGGDAVVCFSIPLDQALLKIDTRKPCNPGEVCQREGSSIGDRPPAAKVFWKMTQAGRRSITSAKPLEQFMAERISGVRDSLDAINQMNLEDARQFLLGPVLGLPAAHSKLEEIHTQLGWIEEIGVSDEVGLIDIDDSGFATGIDRLRCKELQAVIRRDNQLWYDPDIYAKFDTAGKVLIQLHEEIYAWGVEVDDLHEFLGEQKHFTSTPTRRLILKLLSRDPSTDFVNQQLRDLGFSVFHWEQPGAGPVKVGEYMTSETCEAEQVHLGRSFEHPYSIRPVEFAMMVADRYLDTAENYGSEKLIYNYPDELAQLIEFSMEFRGSDGGEFYSQAKVLFDKFNEPTSCCPHLAR